MSPRSGSPHSAPSISDVTLQEEGRAEPPERVDPDAKGEKTEALTWEVVNHSAWHHVVFKCSSSENPASYGLTLGVFVLISGGLGDRYGPRNIFVLGFIKMSAADLGSGFCRTSIPFDICRAIAGIGGALILPNAAGLLGRAYPPGRMRTIGFSILGALAPAGSICGGIMAALISQTIGVRWCFFITAMLSAGCAGLGLAVLPREPPETGLPPLDVLGFALGGSGLTLLNFCFNQGALVGWTTPYIYSLLIVSILILVVFFLWEGRLGQRALVPLTVFTKQAVLVLLALWWGWMSFGTYLYYTAAYLREVQGYSALVVGGLMSPLAPGGIIAALLLIVIFPRLEGHFIFGIALACFCLGNLLMAVTPTMNWEITVYLAQAIIVLGSDFSFASASLILANSVPREVQGTTSSLVQVIVNYSLSLGLGFAGTVESYVNNGGNDIPAGVRGAFYFATGVAFIGFLVLVGFVRTQSKVASGH